MKPRKTGYQANPRNSVGVSKAHKSIVKKFARLMCDAYLFTNTENW